MLLLRAVLSSLWMRIFVLEFKKQTYSAAMLHILLSPNYFLTRTSKIHLIVLNLKWAPPISWNLVKCSELLPTDAGQSLFCQARNIRLCLGIWVSFSFFFLLKWVRDRRKQTNATFWKKSFTKAPLIWQVKTFSRCLSAAHSLSCQSSPLLFLLLLH